jgi:glycosyltransferase involved in cell wall biosynthesis
MSGRDPITVLHARIVTGTGGGPEKTILNSPRHLEGTRYRALAAYLHAPGDAGIEILRARALERRCPFAAFEERRRIDFRVMQQLADLCLVTTMHGWVKHTAKTPLYFAVDRWCLPRYEQVVAVSRDLFDAALDCGVDPAHLVQIDNAIDTQEFRRARRAGESPLRKRPGSILVGAVGRLSEEKGFGLLIEAVERCIDRGLDLELWIAGEGEEQARLEARMRASPHSARFALLGFQRDTIALFEAFDLFALSSLREGLPNVVLEAMAMEVPLVATRSGGMGAFGRDGVDMRLVDVGSVAALQRGIEELARDPILRTQLARAARTRIDRDLSFTARMKKMVAVYDRLAVQ